VVLAGTVLRIGLDSSENGQQPDKAGQLPDACLGLAPRRLDPTLQQQKKDKILLLLLPLSLSRGWARRTETGSNTEQVRPLSGSCPAVSVSMLFFDPHMPRKGRARSAVEGTGR
jgi:hypothetical protein